MKKVDFDANGGWADAGSPTLRQGDFIGVPVWTTEGNAGDYTLAPSQWMAIELGQLFDETGVIVDAGDNEELAASTQYVVRVLRPRRGRPRCQQPDGGHRRRNGRPGRELHVLAGLLEEPPGRLADAEPHARHA